MKYRFRNQAIAALIVAALAAPLAVAEAGDAGRTRPGKSSAGSSGASRGSSGGGRTRVSGSSHTGGQRTRVSGKSTYGRYRGYRYWGGYWRHHGPYLGWYYGSYPFYPYYPYYPWHHVPSVHVYRLPASGPAAVEIDIRPKRATVTLDGDEIGRAKEYNGNWNYLWLEPGTYELAFSADGYKTLKAHLRVMEGRHYRFVDRLEKGEGLDPRSTSEPPPPPAPKAGTRPLPEEAAEAELPSALRRGLLHIRIEPADAAVYLDGEFLANAVELSRLHGALPVAVGVHKIEVVRPGYAGQVVEVTVSEQEPAVLELALERE